MVVVTNISYMQNPIPSLSVGETDIGSENSHSDYFGCRLLCNDISTWKRKENFRKALLITLFIHAFEHGTQSNESHYKSIIKDEQKSQKNTNCFRKVHESFQKCFMEEDL